MRFYNEVHKLMKQISVFEHQIYENFIEKKHLAKTFYVCRTQMKNVMPIWVHFGGFCNGGRWYILWPFGQL
jgi:hypothetical protein